MENIRLVQKHLEQCEVPGDQDTLEGSTVCRSQDRLQDAPAASVSHTVAGQQPSSVGRQRRNISSSSSNGSQISSWEDHEVDNYDGNASSTSSMSGIDPCCREMHLFSSGMGIDYFTGSHLSQQLLRRHCSPPSVLDSRPHNDHHHHAPCTDAVVAHLGDRLHLRDEGPRSAGVVPTSVDSAYTQASATGRRGGAGGSSSISPSLSSSSSGTTRVTVSLPILNNAMLDISRLRIIPSNHDSSSPVVCTNTRRMRRIRCPCCRQFLQLCFSAADEANEERRSEGSSGRAIITKNGLSSIGKSSSTEEKWVSSNQPIHQSPSQLSVPPSLRLRLRQRQHQQHQPGQEQPVPSFGISEGGTEPISREGAEFSIGSPQRRRPYQQQQQQQTEEEENSHLVVGASLFPSLPTFSPTSFVRAYVGEGSYPWEATLHNQPALIVSCCVAAMNMVVVQFLQHHVLDTRDHLGLFVVGTYMIFSTYYMTYYFLERYSLSFRRISQEKKFYTIANLIKAGILVSLVPFATLHLSKIILFDVWDTNTLRNLGCIYTIPDFVSMIVVKRMSWSTWTHHLCVLLFNFFSTMNDYTQENVCRCVVVYAAFSTFAYCVNVLLASRFLGVPPNVARVLSYIAVVVYIFFCATNWVWQVYYLRKLLRDGHDHWTVYAYMLLICLVMYDDITLNKWLLHNARSTAFAAAQHQQHQLWQQRQQQQRQEQQ